MTSEREGDRMEKKEEKWTEILSWEPRAFFYHKFLSKEKREYLITLAKPHMVKSTVVDAETGRSKDSRYLSSLTSQRPEHGEELQVLHYDWIEVRDSH